MGFAPSTVANIKGVSGIVSSLAGLAGGLMGNRYSSSASDSMAKSAQLAAEAQAQLAETNASIADLQAEAALSKGNAAVARLTQQAGQMKSAQRAGMAARGIDLGQGNAAEILASTDMMKDVDKATLIYNALNESFGYRTNAINARAQAGMARAQGMAAGVSGYSSGTGYASTLITGASSLSKAWDAWLKTSDSNNAPVEYATMQTKAGGGLTAGGFGTLGSGTYGIIW
jgi:hypothetical protein